MSDAAPSPLQDEPTPPWTRDLPRVIGLMFLATIFVSLLTGLASLGLMRDKAGTDTIETDALWAGICAGLLTLLSPFLIMEYSQGDGVRLPSIDSDLPSRGRGGDQHG